MNTLKFVNDDLYDYTFMRLWRSHLRRCCFRFREDLANEFYARHYGLEPRKVKFSEVKMYPQKFKELALALNSKYPGRLSKKSLSIINHPWRIMSLWLVKNELRKIPGLKKFYDFIRGIK